MTVRHSADRKSHEERRVTAGVRDGPTKWRRLHAQKFARCSSDEGGWLMRKRLRSMKAQGRSGFPRRGLWRIGTGVAVVAAIAAAALLASAMSETAGTPAAVNSDRSPDVILYNGKI